MGRRPLYKAAANASFECGNAGLWYDKFCDRWNADWKGLEASSGKRRWIETVANGAGSGGAPNRVGDRGLLEEVAVRMKDLAEKSGGQVVRLTTAWRFVTGLGRSHPVENGFAWHHTLGTPYLPGSSLKGVARAWARDWSGLGDEDVARIFGPEASAKLGVGSVIFLDALPDEPVALEADVMTPHYGSWYRGENDAVPSDDQDPVPIPFLTVAPGQSFFFAVLPRTAFAIDGEDCRTGAKLVKSALDVLGAGAKTAVGYGQFVAEQAPVPKPAASERARAARSELRVGGEAIAYDEVVKVRELRNEMAVVEFSDGTTEEVSRAEVRPR